MLDTLGPAGVVGIVLAIVGFAAVAMESLLVAGGLVLVVAGMGLLARSLVSGLLGAFGMDGMF